MKTEKPKIYKCDSCLKEHELNESVVKDKQYYVQPYSCSGGDYYKHYYYFFECDACGRNIEVSIKDLLKPYSCEEDQTPHRGICPYYYNEPKEVIADNAIQFSIDDVNTILKACLLDFTKGRLTKENLEWTNSWIERNIRNPI